MHQRWAFGKEKPLKEGVVLHVKKLFTRPWHVLLLVVGFALVMSAAHIHAYSPVPVNMSTSFVQLQPGSELPIEVEVLTPYGKNALVSFSTEYPSNVLHVDGELQSISTSFPLNQTLRIGAVGNAPPGTYGVLLHVHITLDGQTVTETQFITVEVGPKSFVTYFTSPNSTLAPTISHVVFSKDVLILRRNETESFSVSFVNTGSATDYLVRLSEQPLGYSVDVSNAMHRFVSPGETVTTFFDVATSPASPFGITPLRIEAYDLVSGEKTFLGTMEVRIVEMSNIELSIPFHEFIVEKNDSYSSYITIQNTEYQDVDVIVESSSSLVQVQSRQVHVPSKSSVSVPLVIRASPSIGARNETVYVMNAQLTKSFTFIVTTVEEGTLNVPMENEDSIPEEETPGTGLVTGTASTLLGVLLLVLIALFIFSTQFRTWVQSKFPKPVFHEVHDKKPMDLETTAASSKIK